MRPLCCTYLLFVDKMLSPCSPVANKKSLRSKKSKSNSKKFKKGLFTVTIASFGILSINIFSNTNINIFTRYENTVINNNYEITNFIYNRYNVREIRDLSNNRLDFIVFPSPHGLPRSVKIEVLPGVDTIATFLD